MANLNDTIKYLDLVGLGQYDALIKKYSDDNDASIREALESAIGEGGNVATQIQNAINALKGTLGQDDAATLEAINDELDGIDTAIATLNGDNTTSGSVAKAVKDGIDAIGTGTAQGAAGQAITSLTQTNGVVTATSGDIAASHVTVDWGTEDPVSSTANVQAALNEVYNKLDENAEAGEVAVYENGVKVNAIAADGKTYTFKQGTNTIATMNIAKDMVVSSGSVVTATGSETDVPESQTLVVGQKYVRLVIKDSADGKNIYIPVNELYDDYSFTDSAEIDFTESGNDVTASIKAGSIAESKLDNALQAKISSARTVITEIAQGDPADKHILVTKTAGVGANPDTYTISESDIASAAGLSAEVTRAKAAESAIDGAIGLTKAADAETRTYSSNVGGATVTADINTLDSRLDSVETFISNLTAISSAEITALFAVNSGD